MDGDIREAVTRPRPGHADLNGVLKYNLKDIRDVIERASARETAMRTAVGAFAAVFLKQFGIRDRSRVIQIGRVIDRTPSETLDFDYIENSQVMCSNPECEQDMMEEIKRAYEKGDSLGGRFEVVISNVPIGIGSYTQWDRKLDTRLAGAVMSIQGIKAVEMGNGFESALIPGSKFHDEICYTKSRGFYRLSNNAGGVEGGISNGEDIIVRASMKPIPTLRIPLRSVDIFTGEPAEAVFERSDVCAVTAAGIVARNACMWEIACSFLDKFGGDSIEEVTANYQRYISGLCCRNKK
jgi:chorismate synthase